MSGRELALFVGAAFAAASSRFPARDSDLFWHLATARAALESGIVREDRFSWTARGAPVAIDQWLGQLLWYGAYLLDRWRGVVALRSLAVFAIVALVAGEAIARRPARPLAGVVASLPALFLVRFVWTERPELFGLVCFAALLPLLRRGREGSDAALVLTAPLLVVWANLHGSFALGVALAVLVSIDGLLRDVPRRPRYVLATFGALLATVATPAGLATLAAPGFHLLHPPREIQEWSVPDPTTLAGAIWALTLAAIVATAFLAPRPRAVDALTLLPVAFLSLVATRHMPLLAIAAAPYLAERGPDALAALLRRRWAGAAERAPRERIRAAGALALTAAVVLLAASSLSAPAEPDLAGFPADALAVLPRGPGLLNTYDWGGWLIWYAPDTPVFVDGRLVPYLDGVLDDYRAVVGLHPEWRDVLARRGVRTLLVRPSDAIAVRATDLGWRVRASGPDFVVIEVIPDGRAEVANPSSLR